MNVWKKQTVRKANNRKKETLFSKRFYGTLTLADGRKKQMPLMEDEKSSLKLLIRLQTEEDRKKVLWKTLAAMCQHAGLGDEPRRVLSELSDVRLMDVVLPTKAGIKIRIRCSSKPTKHQQILLDHLGLRLPSKIKHAGM